MARLFISCNNHNFEIGKKLEAALISHGHVMTLGVVAKPAGRWEEQLLRALHTADAFICLLTPEGMKSSWVVSQTGMAISCEYTKDMLVMPVCPKDEIPNFAAAFHCFWLTDDIEALAKDLHEAIESHRQTRPPRIFISHLHKDAEIAINLIHLIESAFAVEKRDIRCTSVPGYRLVVGSQSSGSLQADLNGAEIVMGLIGPNTSESEYVLFELGASWGLRKPTFPLRIKSATYSHVPEVLREKSSLSLENVPHCIQLVEDIARISSIERKKATEDLTAVVQRSAEQLASVAKA